MFCNIQENEDKTIIALWPEQGLSPNKWMALLLV